MKRIAVSIIGSDFPDGKWCSVIMLDGRKLRWQQPLFSTGTEALADAEQYLRELAVDILAHTDAERYLRDICKIQAK